MSNHLEFKPWPKIPRGNTEKICITEKIDGTNACIVIQDDKIVAVQSRKRFITPDDDNYGFARWVEDNNEELLQLGEGHHYGEWAGVGINKNPHSYVTKLFLLFNVNRWGKHNPRTPEVCCVVPTIYVGDSTDTIIESSMEDLLRQGKELDYTPEGIIVWYCRSRRYEKYTFKNSEGKWKEG